MAPYEIACPELLNRITGAAEAASFIKDGMTVAFGGYTSAGYPKAVPHELAARKASGENLGIAMITGSMTAQLDDVLADVAVRRAPMFESKQMRRHANAQSIRYVETQIPKMLRLLYGGAFGRIDVAVVEALSITREGFLVPTACVGILSHIVGIADAVIIEINRAQPAELEGLHDTYTVDMPPNRQPVPLLSVAHRIGESFVRVDKSKIKAIVYTDTPDEAADSSTANGTMRTITDNLFNFLEAESANRWGGKIPPIQTGVGNLANCISKSFGTSKFDDLGFFCGALHEANMELIASGKVIAASAGSIQMTPRTVEIVKAMGVDLRDTLVLRGLDVTNDAESIGRMGILALNSGIEIDIYGNVNASHIGGANVVNGIGGGAHFAQNARLSVMLLPSTGKGGDISTVVPMVSHVDVIEHDVDVLITEHGVADLRGADDVERAERIVAVCASPLYRDELHHYLRAAKKAGGHHPQLPFEAFEWHRRLRKKGTMLPGRPIADNVAIGQ